MARVTGRGCGVCVWCVGGVVRLLCWDKGGAGDVAEGDVGGHLQGHTSGKGTDLFMYVHEKGVRAPAAHLFDGVGVDAVQVHGHCAAST